MFQGLDWTDRAWSPTTSRSSPPREHRVFLLHVLGLTVVIVGARGCGSRARSGLGPLGYVVVSGLTMSHHLRHLAPRVPRIRDQRPARSFVAATCVYARRFGAMNWDQPQRPLGALLRLGCVSPGCAGSPKTDRSTSHGRGRRPRAQPLREAPEPCRSGARSGHPLTTGSSPRRSFGRLGKEVGAFAGGYAGGVACAFRSWLRLGHVGYFVSAVRSLFGLAAQENDFHGSAAADRWVDLRQRLRDPIRRLCPRARGGPVVRDRSRDRPHPVQGPRRRARGEREGSCSTSTMSLGSRSTRES